MEWRHLRESAGSDVIVAVDFGPGRREASFSDLAHRLGISCTVLEPVFPDIHKLDDRVLEPDSYCRGWLENLRESGRSVVAVLGYCASSDLARVLARSAALPGTPRPRVMLFDPVILGPSAFYRAYSSAISTFKEAMTSEELRLALEKGREVSLDVTSRVYGTRQLLTGAKALGVEYHRVVSLVGERLGFAEELSAELAARFSSYLGYLAVVVIAAVDLGEFPSPDEYPPPIVMSSSGHRLSEELRVATILKFDVSRAGLLADDKVAADATGLLAQLGC